MFCRRTVVGVGSAMPDSDVETTRDDHLRGEGRKAQRGSDYAERCETLFLSPR
jgi:hypothetical protein